MIKSVVVFASGIQLDETQFEDVPVDALSEVLVGFFGTMKYGGSNHGLMFAVAKAFAERGGDVIGVFPRWLKDAGYTAESFQEVQVDSLAERKLELLRDADAILCLPGGVGTLDEVFTHLAQVSFREVAKPLPILFYDHHGYYRPLELMFQVMNESGAFDKDRFPLHFLETPHHVAEILKTLRAESEA